MKSGKSLKGKCLKIDWERSNKDGIAVVAELKTPTKNVVRILDEMGRDATPVPNKTFIYLYSDGTVERKLIVKE